MRIVHQEWRKVKSDGFRHCNYDGLHGRAGRASEKRSLAQRRVPLKSLKCIIREGGTGSRPQLDNPNRRHDVSSSFRVMRECLWEDESANAKQTLAGNTCRRQATGPRTSTWKHESFINTANKYRLPLIAPTSAVVLQHGP